MSSKLAIKQSTETPSCLTCRWHKPLAYVSHWEHIRSKGAGFAPLRKYIFEKVYGKLHCAQESKDKENFPFKLAEMSNYDDKLLPRHCGHYMPKPKLLLFSNITRGWHFIGAFTDLELCEKAELNTRGARVMYNFRYFSEEIDQKYLKRLVLEMPNPPDETDVPDDIDHETAWYYLQLSICDLENYDRISCWDWLRMLFHRMNARYPLSVMTKYGAYKLSTVRTVIKDLRTEKYAKGKVIDIRPYRPYVRHTPDFALKNGMTKEQEIFYYYSKFYERVK
jgi:hypothetical protein